MCSQNMDWYIVSAREALVAILVISTVMLSSWIKKVGPSADEWIESCGTYTQWSITQPLKRIHLNQF